MASSDFIYDLLDHLEKDNTDYLLVTVDKCKEADKVEVFYQAGSAQSERCIVFSFKKLVEQIQKGEGLDGGDQVDYGWVSREELDEHSQTLDEDDEDDEDKIQQ